MAKQKSAKIESKTTGHHPLKAAKTQPKASAHPQPKAASADPKHNGRSAVKNGRDNAIPKSNGVASERTTMPRAQAQKAPVPHRERKLEKFQGVLQDFNLSPKGGIEGFLLRSDEKTVQVNVTPDVGFAVVRGIGQHVEATVEATTTTPHRGDHPVYNLVSLAGTEGKTLIFAGHGDAETKTVQGVVKRINFGRDGAANGVVLESGDFIYVKPEGMKHVELKVGDQVTAEGTAAFMPLGQQMIEAKTVNDVTLVAKTSARAASRKS
jgi:hypothetical protein